MRKASTTAVRGKGKLQDQQLTIGLDLGDRSSFYCVLNGAGEVIPRGEGCNQSGSDEKGL
jgi:transposase